MKIRLKDKTEIEVSAFEERYRDIFFNGAEVYRFLLNIEIVNSPKELEYFVKLLTPENLSFLEVLDDKNEVLATYTKYKILKDINKQFKKEGIVLTCMNIMD